MKISILDKSELSNRLKNKGFKIITVDYKCIDENDDSYYRKPEKKSIIVKDDLADKVTYVGWQAFLFYITYLMDSAGKILGSIGSKNSPFGKRTVENSDFSEVFDTNVEAVLVNDNLIKWLEFNQIKYSDIMKEIPEDVSLAFEKCHNIEITSDGNIVYCSNTMILKSEEIKEILNSIDDKLLKLKLEEIFNIYGERIHERKM